ncbi:MAG: VOC family protein [Anaerolineae bacterium]|nr:VOC family protein [Anaerolineae bacterium]
MNLNYVIVYVRDLGNMKAFYADVLGMTALDAVSSPTFVTLRSDGGALIGLQDKAAAQVAAGQDDHPGHVELSFEVDDVDATWQRWQAHGVEAVAAPMDMPFGRYCLAKDPEGHYLSAYRFKR